VVPPLLSRCVRALQGTSKGRWQFGGWPQPDPWALGPDSINRRIYESAEKCRGWSRLQCGKTQCSIHCMWCMLQPGVPLKQSATGAATPGITMQWDAASTDHTSQVQLPHRPRRQHRLPLTGSVASRKLVRRPHTCSQASARAATCCSGTPGLLLLARVLLLLLLLVLLLAAPAVLEVVPLARLGYVAASRAVSTLLSWLKNSSATSDQQASVPASQPAPGSPTRPPGRSLPIVQVPALLTVGA
jgi:hypothetical protein